jgi:uncharacterized protein YabE (DUF348 family)
VILRMGAQVWRVDTRALTVGWALHDAGVVLSDQDEVTPGIDERLPWQDAAITIMRPRPVSVWKGTEGLIKTWWTSEDRPDRLLAVAGVTLQNGDQLLWNGAPLAMDQPLPAEDEVLLQVRVAQAVTIRGGAQEKTVNTTGPTTGQALWSAGVMVTPLDFLSSPYNTPLAQTRVVAIQPAVPFRILVDGKEMAGRSTVATVGQALAEAGLALQDLDYAVPAEDQPLPLDGRVRVVRVREAIELQQTALPFKNETVPDPTVELDQTRIVQVGQPGAQVKRVRVRYEDGKEVSRQAEIEWLASSPKNQQIGYGTKIVVRTLDTPDGSIEYWRKVTVYATSFAPCNFIKFIGKCSYSTAAGYPLQKGVIGVGAAWYKLMKGWGVYVDGYGSARVGDYGYIPGFWVDLGYSDADFVNWHRNTTLYFLTPVPANVPWTLPK